MAKKTLIIDDLTGESGARTRRFTLDGTAYEIDLTDASYADLRAALKPFIRAGRTAGAVKDESGARVTTPRAGSGAGTAARSRATAKKTGTRRAARAKAPAGEHTVIRDWARANGVHVTMRGRVNASARQAWVAAGSPGAATGAGDASPAAGATAASSATAS